MPARVLHVHTLPVISGSGINTFLSMRDIDRGRFEPELSCAPGGDLIDLVKKSGMRTRLFPNFVQPADPINDLLASIKLTQFLRTNFYHIIHTHNSKAGFIGRLAGRLAGVPVIIHTVHGFSFHDREPLWRRFLFKNLERLAAPCADRMIFISQPLIDWAITEKIGDPKKFSKIYSGIEVKKFTPPTAMEKQQARVAWEIEPDDFVVGIVSKLWEGKGHSDLIRALKLLNEDNINAKLVILGDGHLLQKLEAIVQQYNLREKVIFAGFHKDVSGVMAAFDVSVLPSYFEGMGRVLLEAMAMGIPVVGTLVGGIPDIIDNEINGLLVQPGDPKELSEAIKRICNDQEFADRLGQAGMRKVTEKFSAGTMVREIEKVYRECLAAKGIGI